MKTRHILTVLLLSLVLASGWFLHRPRTLDATDAGLQRGPDMFAGQIEVTVMNAAGNPNWRITANRIQHSPEHQRFELTHPFIRASGNGGQEWTISSDTGQMNDAGDRLQFNGEVNILGKGERSMQIQTRDLLIKPEEELAETDNAVRITLPGYEVHAIGFKADFKSRLLELQSRVRGTIHVPG